MVVDALLAAEPVLKISERIYDPAKYLYLTDGILQEIEQSTDPVLSLSLSC
jgi:deoxynucleoside triphosphate triphosphohydrolase SAMHD1